MADPRVVRLARVLVEYCCEVQPGDLVSISGMPPAKPLLQEIYQETLRAEGRKFENADGKKNMPDGEIFSGPVEDSVNGWVRFTYPAVTQGREIEGVELRFDAGKVVEAKASKGEAFLLALLDTDPGARYLGEWAIGTNKMINRFVKNILFDEKIGGTIHMAIGAGYPETGSLNKSAIHMDMICDMRKGGQLIVDGELIYDSGEFKI